MTKRKTFLEFLREHNGKDIILTKFDDAISITVYNKNGLVDFMKDTYMLYKEEMMEVFKALTQVENITLHIQNAQLYAPGQNDPIVDMKAQLELVEKQEREIAEQQAHERDENAPGKNPLLYKVEDEKERGW